MASALITVSPVAAAQALDCDPLLSVETDRDDLAGPLCELARSARDGIAACGIPQSAPVLITVAGPVGHLPGGCLSAYDCDARTISIADPVSLDAMLGPDDAYRALPESVVLRNLLTHELVHALIAQSEGGPAAPLVHEYVAGALEIDGMEPAWRDTLLEAAGVAAPPRDGLISLGIYMLEPRAFAANAWLHFRAPDRGCGFVRALISGEARLPPK